jgi:hypothetical protein
VLLPDWVWPLLGSILLLTLGAAMLRDGRAGGRITGPLLMLAGLAGLVWRIRIHWQEWEALRAAREAKERRKALLAARRERNAQERVRRQEQKAARASATARAAEALAAERQGRLQAAQEALEHRLEQERLATAEAARLRRLDDASLQTEVASVFALCGLMPEHPPSEAECDLLLSSNAEGSRHLARCVPVQRQASAVDVRELETWRQETGSRHAYLISLAGFSPAAVRLAQNLPLTLVEAHLLAQWKQAGKIL